MNYIALQRQPSLRANFDPRSSAAEKGILLKACFDFVLLKILTAPLCAQVKLLLQG